MTTNIPHEVLTISDWIGIAIIIATVGGIIGLFIAFVVDRKLDERHGKKLHVIRLFERLMTQNLPMLKKVPFR